MKLVVNVTEEDIKNGKKCPLSCPITLALSRITKEKWWTGLNECGIVGQEKCWSLPKAARSFVQSFDERDGENKVKPFTFELE